MYSRIFNWKRSRYAILPCLVCVALIAVVIVVPGCRRRRRTSPVISRLPQPDAIGGIYQGTIVNRDPESSMVTIELIKAVNEYSDLPLFKIRRHIGEQFTFEDFALAPELGTVPLNSEVEIQSREELPVPSFITVFWGKAAASGRIVPGY